MIATIAFVGLGLVLVGVAIPLLRRKVPPNHLYGLRVRETLADEVVWYEANARSARELLVVGVGAMVLPAALLVLPWRSPDDHVLACLALIVAAVIVVCVRGARIARRVAREISGTAPGFPPRS